ncbi:MAG: hypothetical protein WC121_00465 [Candidatus Kapaibacterium sp.]
MRFALTILILIALYSTSFTQDEKIFESFVDSISINQNLSFKVEFLRYGLKPDKDHWVKIIFLKKEINYWEEVFRFESERNQTHINFPKLEDFNSDGFLDFSYVPFLAAKGANELRELFVFDSVSNNFIHIKNSSDYPNLKYNVEFDNYTGWAFHGGTTQYFLSLEVDTLIELASIDINGFERGLTIYDRNGEVSFSKFDSIQEEGFPFYKNYDPIEE